MHMRRFVGLSGVLSTAAVAVLMLSPAIRSQADQALPAPQFPDENPMLPNQDILGKFLFWEEQMGSDNTMACGTCHIHEAGGSDPRAFGTIHPGPDGQFNTSDDIHGSAGVVRQDVTSSYQGSNIFFPGVQVTGRKAPTTINAAFEQELFWDGRAPSAYTDPQTGLVEILAGGALESQAKGPPGSDVEMAHEGQNWNAIVAKLAVVKPAALATSLPTEMQDFLTANPTYPAMFNAVYGSPTITSKKVMFAIGNYERTLIANQTPFDLVLQGAAMPPDLQPGFDLFQGKANCAACHLFPFTTDHSFHNIGVRPDAEDVGRMNVTSDVADMAKFKTPGIRNSKLRLPLFHNGSKNTVTDLVEFYNNGGEFLGPNTDALLLPLALTAQEKTDLIHFIEVGLTDPRVENNQFPFTRPTLRSEMPPLNNVFGVASPNGIGQLANVIANIPANRGHPNWLLGVSNATANQPAIMAYSYGPGSGAPFPDPRFPIPMNINAGSIFLIQFFTTDGFGVATAKLSIPSHPALAGMSFYTQWFINDAAALATGGVYGSKGTHVTIL